MVGSELELNEYRRKKYGLCGVNCYQNHNLMSSLSMMPLYFLTLVDDMTHWPRQNYEKDCVSNVRGLLCGCGREWQINNDGKKLLRSLSKCAWKKITGDVICSNYEKSSNHGLNRIKSYLDLAIKSTCRCQPSITLCKHSRIELSRICKSKCSNHSLRQEDGYCPWCIATCGEFCTTCLHYCGIQHGQIL